MGFYLLFYDGQSESFVLLGLFAMGKNVCVIMIVQILSLIFCQECTKPEHKHVSFRCSYCFSSQITVFSLACLTRHDNLL